VPPVNYTVSKAGAQATPLNRPGVGVLVSAVA
jgi:hypothetical protein